MRPDHRGAARVQGERCRGADRARYWGFACRCRGSRTGFAAGLRTRPAQRRTMTSRAGCARSRSAAGKSTTRSTTGSCLRACVSPIPASSCASRSRSGNEASNEVVPGAGKAESLPARARQARERGACGYHELQTVFRLVDRADRVGIALREDGEIRFSGVYGEENLCVRAARLLKKTAASAARAPTSRWRRTFRSAAAWGAAPPTPRRFSCVLNELWNLHLPLGRLIALGKEAGRGRARFRLRPQRAWRGHRRAADAARPARRLVPRARRRKSRFPRRKSSLPR